MAAAATEKKRPVKGTKQPVRLYVRGIVLGYQRSKVNQNPSRSLLQLENVKTRKDTAFYLGKRVAYVYKAKTEKKGTKFRTIWGKICRPHGNSGVVRARFRKNLPPKSFGGRVRVFLYPSNI
ncbi:60s ribosomal protein L33-A, putative [Eimeria mitis]|uniref:60s ribosomal protein L33-A, putative n=1 Tax=Eimeria mitis TaxID=44415 RepID=U6KEI1_9EIME|nr:60s ribosomal protein L33-A, putative [Eimeria mitis]CDJ36329.1 60s ribosomal protein L33-A, putative [Eimeria mitis]